MAYIGKESKFGFSYTQTVTGSTSPIVALDTPDSIGIDQVLIFKNGALLSSGGDYTFSTPNLNLATPLIVSDILTIIYLGTPYQVPVVADNSVVEGKLSPNLQNSINRTKFHSSVINETSYTAENRSNKYLVNTDTAETQFALPANPAFGTMISIIDATGSANTNNITIVTTDSSTIQGNANLIMNAPRVAIELVYGGSSIGWVVTDNHSFL